MEETERPRYPKDLHVGRIVIEEIPEEREKVASHDILKKDEVKPKHEDKPYEVEKVPRAQVKEEVIKVGRLDITDYEKMQKGSERLEQRKTYFTERTSKDQKVA